MQCLILHDIVGIATLSPACPGMTIHRDRSRTLWPTLPMGTRVTYRSSMACLLECGFQVHISLQVVWVHYTLCMTLSSGSQGCKPGHIPNTVTPLDFIVFHSASFCRWQADNKISSTCFEVQAAIQCWWHSVPLCFPLPNSSWRSSSRKIHIFTVIWDSAGDCKLIAVSYAFDLEHMPMPHMARWCGAPTECTQYSVRQFSCMCANFVWLLYDIHFVYRQHEFCGVSVPILCHTFFKHWCLDRVCLDPCFVLLGGLSVAQTPSTP